MSSVGENIKSELKKKLLERVRQASVDNFILFKQFLDYESQVMSSSSTAQIVVYDSKHAALSVRDIYKKIAECTKVDVIETTGSDGSIESKIQVTCDGLDLSEPYIKDSFQKMLNNVNSRMQYNIRS